MLQSAPFVVRQQDTEKSFDTDLAHTIRHADDTGGLTEDVVVAILNIAKYRSLARSGQSRHSAWAR